MDYNKSKSNIEDSVGSPSPHSARFKSWKGSKERHFYRESFGDRRILWDSTKLKVLYERPINQQQGPQSSSLLKKIPDIQVTERHPVLSFKECTHGNFPSISESHPKYLQKQTSLNRRPVVKITIFPASKSLKKQRKQWNKTQKLQTTARDHKNCLSSQNVYMVSEGQARKKVYEIKASGSEDLNPHRPCENGHIVAKNLQTLVEYEKPHKKKKKDARKGKKAEDFSLKHGLEKAENSKLSPFKECMCTVKNATVSPQRSKVRITGRIDLMDDDDRSVLGSIAAIDGKPNKSAEALMKHYQGDKCRVPNPLQRDKEIRELLGVQRLGTSRSTQISRTFMDSSKFHDSSHISHQNDGCNNIYNIQNVPELTLGPLPATEETSEPHNNKLDINISHESSNSCKISNINKQTATKKSSQDFKSYTGWQKSVFTIDNHVLENNRREIGDNCNETKNLSDGVVCQCHHSLLIHPSDESRHKNEPELVINSLENKISSIDLVCESQQSSPIQVTVKAQTKNPKREYQTKATTELYFTQEISRKACHPRKNNIDSQICETFQRASQFVLARKDFAQQTSASNNSNYQNASLALSLNQQTYCKIHTQNYMNPDKVCQSKISYCLKDDSGDRLFKKVSYCNGHYNLRVPKNRSYKNYKIPFNLDKFSRKKPIVLSRKQYARLRRVILQATPKKICSINKRSSITIGKIKIKRIVKNCPVISTGTQTDKTKSHPPQLQQTQIYGRGTDFKISESQGAGDTLISQTVKQKDNVINPNEKPCYVYYMNTEKVFSDRSLTSRYLSSCTEICCTSVRYENNTCFLTSTGKQRNINAKKEMHRSLKKKSSLFCLKKRASPNLGTTCPSTEYIVTNTQSNVELSKQNQRTRKPFFRRLISCLVMRFKISGAKIGIPPAKPPSNHNSTDWYHISTSLQTLELSSSIYETTASFYTNHSVYPINNNINNNKTRGGILNSVRALLTNRRI